MSATNTNSSIPTERLLPVRPSAGPTILQPPYIHRQESALSDHASSSSNLPSTSGRNEQPSNIDMRSLAQEVAAVLYQNQPGVPRHKNSHDLRGQQQAELLVQNDDQEDTLSQTNEQPPNYHAATGPSIGLPGKV